MVLTKFQKLVSFTGAACFSKSTKWLCLFQRNCVSFLFFCNTGIDFRSRSSKGVSCIILLAERCRGQCNIKHSIVSTYHIVPRMLRYEPVMNVYLLCNYEVKNHARLLTIVGIFSLDLLHESFEKKCHIKL